MKIQLFLISVFCALNANAQDYLITFSGTGASANVSTVKVENLTAGTSLILNGNDILHLKAIITGVNSIKDDQSSDIKIYPNPMSDNSTMQIYAPVAGDAVITVLDITGKPVAQIQSYLENSRQDFNLAGLKTGIYIINVKGNNYQLSEKLLSNGQTGGTISIEKVNVVIQKAEEKAPEKVSKGLSATVDMAYTSGDRLKFTGISGNYSTVKIDIPTSDKTIAFNFIACTDVDNNNYPVVEIGDQIWMEENLKTTRYSDSFSIPLVTDPDAWAALTTPGYHWYLNDPNSNKDKYGGLYNWYAAVSANKGGKNICPAGWHVPSRLQWNILTNWLVNNGHAYLGQNPNVSKSLATTTGWPNSSVPGAPGNNQASNNSSGFSGIPIGGVASWWSTDQWFNEGYGLLIYSSSGYLEYVAQMASMSTGRSIRCLKGDLVFSTITTSSVSEIQNGEAKCGGNIVSDGGEPVIERGVCCSSLPNPTILDWRSTDGTGIGEFTSTIKWLNPGTTYYVRAYSTNSSCTTYGNEIRFCTWPKISDIEGNIYNTINIGTQIWMVENLKTTRYNNGDLIGTTSPATNDIRSEDTPEYQWAYDGNENNVETYGRLYTWYAVNDSRKLCPTGWDVPTQADWTILTDYLGGLSISGGKLKEAGTNHWMSPNTGATNETGFTALPGGYRLSSGGFGGLGSDGAWRSSTLDNSNEDWTIGMGNSYPDAYGSSNGKRSGYSVRCFKQIVLPTITTSPVSLITSMAASSGGVLTSDGGSTVISRGVCWSTSANPTVLNNKTTDGTGIVSFVSSITGLSVETTYYVRAYATNSIGIGYGNQVSFTTRRELDPIIYNPDMTYGSISDIDGNNYRTIQIGTQTWMAENLKATHYTDGSSITLVTSNTTWSSLKTEAYCAYNNDLSMLNVYGALYNWFTTTDSRHICPVGWHVPADAEWSTLITFLGGQTLAGGKMKEIGTNHWLYPNTGADNFTGFTGLAAGRRYYDGFGFLGQQAVWLSTTVYTDSYILSRMLLNNDATIATYNPTKNDGCSVRCLKD